MCLSKTKIMVVCFCVFILCLESQFLMVDVRILADMNKINLTLYLMCNLTRLFATLLVSEFMLLWLVIHMTVWMRMTTMGESSCDMILWVSSDIVSCGCVLSSYCASSCGYDEILYVEYVDSYDCVICCGDIVSYLSGTSFHVTEWNIWLLYSLW